MSTDARHDRCGISCTSTTTWDWEPRWTLGGTDSKVSQRFILKNRGCTGDLPRTTCVKCLSWTGDHVETIKRRTCWDDHMWGRSMTRGPLVAYQTRSLKSPCKTNLFIAMDRQDVQFARKKSAGWWRSWRSTQTNRDALPCSAEAAVVLPAADQPSKIAGLSWENWGHERGQVDHTICWRDTWSALQPLGSLIRRMLDSGTGGTCVGPGFHL